MLRFALVYLFVRVCASQCNVAPFELPVKDVQVVPSIPGSILRGIPLAVGTPPQNILLSPWPELNNTWLWTSPGYCDPTVIYSDAICQVRRGNFFDRDASTSFDQAPDVVAAGGATQEIQDSRTFIEPGVDQLLNQSSSGKDKLQIGPDGDNDNDTLAGFPIGLPTFKWDHGWTSTLHALGLGGNSSFLDTLRSTNRASSRVWSLTWGRMWTDTPVDGSLVVGGYNRKNTFGKNATSRIDYSVCGTGLPLDLTDIQVNSRDDNDTSIFPPDTAAMRVCLEPHHPLLAELPAQVLDNFQAVTGFKDSGRPSFGLNWNAMVFNSTHVFDGDITLHFSNGLEIRVPNSQYVLPSVALAANGSRVFNDSLREVAIGSSGSAQPLLGRYFLTAAYLMVDHDAGTFTLWPSSPSAQSDLVAVPPPPPSSAADSAGAKDAVTCPNGAAGNSTGTSAGSGAGAVAQGGLSPGAIAGTAVGSIVGLALLAAIAGAIVVRRRQRRQHPNRRLPSQSPPPSELAVKPRELELPPEPARRSKRHEMASARHEVVEIGGGGVGGGGGGGGRLAEIGDQRQRAFEMG